MSKKCQKSVTRDFETFPGGNGSMRLAVMASIVFPWLHFVFPWNLRTL